MLTRNLHAEAADSVNRSMQSSRNWVCAGKLYNMVGFIIPSYDLDCSSRWKPAWVGSPEEPEETAGATEEKELQWQRLK